MLKNCKIKLSLWNKKISFEVKKSEINVLQNARNAVSARQPNFPPRYLFLWPCLVRRLVGSHPPVKRKKKKLATVLYISCIRSPWPRYCQWHGHEFLAAVMTDTTRRELGQRAEDMFLQALLLFFGISPNTVHNFSTSTPDWQNEKMTTPRLDEESEVLSTM